MLPDACFKGKRQQSNEPENASGARKWIALQSNASIA
jgi:hypothetical protein